MKYQIISIENMNIIKDRFNQCYDGLIENISIVYSDKARWPDVTLIIETQDNLEESGWSKLSLRLIEVREMRIMEGKSSYRVLSEGIILVPLGNWWGIGFEDSVENTKTVKEFIQSSFYFVSTCIEWTVS